MIKAVESVCTVLPSTLANQCKDLISTYGQAIIELLVQQADPKTVCTFLALCNDAQRAYVGELFLQNLPKVMTGTGFSLDFCSCIKVKKPKNGLP